MSIWSRIERRITDLAGELLPDDVRDQLELARAQLTAGNPSTAADILQPVTEARPDHVGALSLLGVAELERGDARAALEAFEQACATRGDIADAQIGRGQALMKLGLLEDAAVAFRSAVESAGGDREVLAVAYRGSGLAYRRLGKLDKAVRELRKAVAESPRDALALTALGEALHAYPDTSDEEAKKYLGWALEADAPALAYLVSGQIALLEERTDDARELFGAAANRAELGGRDSERAAAMIGSADISLRGGDLVAAHQALLRALELAPNNVEIHARLAGVAARGGNTEDALAAYDRVNELGARAAVLAEATTLAIDAGDTERLARFAAAMREADADSEQLALADIALAITIAREGQRSEAMALFSSVLERGDYADAHIELGRLIVSDDPRAAAEHAMAGLRSGALRTRQNARELLGRARRAELGVATDEAMSADLVAAFTGLERLCIARPELASLTRLVSDAATDFDRPLLVTVMGEFSSGKSTFVNAFIGAEVAPTGITPTTATINVVRHGRERGGRILYRDDRSEDIEWDNLFDRLRSLTAEQATEISRVEILMPLDILERVNLVDTPGLNSILPEHEKVAREFIARADAVVWVFSAAQAAKKSEGDALKAITATGVRVLGALNKVDQLSDADIDAVTKMVSEELGDKLEAIVPVSARRAAAGEEGSRWADLEAALDTHFFAHANQLKESAARRKLTEIFTAARAHTEAQRSALQKGAAELEMVAAALRVSANAFEADVVVSERRAIANDLGTLYRDAAREVLELVLPRSLPFGSHKATPADRDYLISLLETRLESALGRSQRRIDSAIRQACAPAVVAEHNHASARDVVVPTALEDALLLFDARVYVSALAYLRGYLRGGFVEHFFRVDLPKIDLAEDAVYHALYRDAPNVDALIGKQLAGAAHAALSAVAERLSSTANALAADVADLEEGTLVALQALEARLETS